MSRPSFSDTWYQVSGLRLGLLPTVRVHKQIYRDQLWYVLQDSCSEKYFRVQQIAYLFLARLTPQKTVDEVWTAFCQTNPEDAPTQNDVISLLSQLHQHNLLFFRSGAEHAGIFERHQKTRRREKLSHLLAFMYFRVPVWNPNALLKKNIAWLGLFFTTPAFLVWLMAAFFGGRAVLGNLDLLLMQTQGVLAADNLIWLFLSLFVLKFLHEMAHAIVCRRYGGDVHTIGIMFIAFMPLPYTDATASWSLRSKWQRSMVAAAGMYVELFIAALAAIVWSQTAPGVVNSLAFNLMLIGSVSSLLFNGNPLLKFDAYYILSDVVDLPNLYQKSSQQWFHLAKRYLLGTDTAMSPAENSYERNWFLSYGFGSFIYRLFVMVIITVYMADISLFLGVLMIFAMSYIWVIGPSYKLLRYLHLSPELHKNRSRAFTAVTASIVGILVILSVVPVSHGMRAPGVVESVQKSSLYAESGGRLLEIHVENGEPVQAGQTLLRFANPELELEYELTGQQLVEVRWLIRRAAEQSTAETGEFEEREQALLARLEDVESRLEQLKILAPHDGIWVSEISTDRQGTEFARGEALGRVLSGKQMQFVGVVSQTDAGYLFDASAPDAQIRIQGYGAVDIRATALQFIPYERYQLPSPALSIPGGGMIAATPDGNGQMRSQEPFFEIIAQLPEDYPIDLYDGALGYMRIRLEALPPLKQLALHIRQLLQGRYRL